MRTAAIPFQSDTVGSRVTEARAVAFDVAASNFVEVNLSSSYNKYLPHQRETAVAADLIFLCPHAHHLTRASRAIFVASEYFMHSTRKDHKGHSNAGCSEKRLSHSHFITQVATYVKSCLILVAMINKKTFNSNPARVTA